LNYQIGCIICALRTDIEQLLQYNEQYFVGKPQEIFKVVINLYSQFGEVSEELLKENLDARQLKYYEIADVDITKKDQYFKQLEDQYTNRKLLGLSNYLKQNTVTVSEKIGIVGKTLDVVTKTTSEKTVQSLGEIYQDVLKDINSGSRKCLHFGIESLDNEITGIFENEYVIIGGWPSVGKTALAIQLHINMSVQKEIPTAIFSLEMPAKDLVYRIIANMCDIDLHKFGTYNFTKEEMRRIEVQSKKLGKSPLYVVELPSPNIYSILKECSKLIRTEGIQLFSLDFIQRLSETDNKHAEISTISKRIKDFTKETGVPLLVLSQLKRVAEKDKNGRIRRPEIFDLKESGSLEQDADKVVLVYRESYQNKDLIQSENENVPNRLINDMELNVVKNKNGRIGMVHCTYTKKNQRIF